MRILYINSLYPPDIGGGAEISLSNIVKGMAGRGHSTAVLTTHPGRGLKVSDENGITIYRSGIRNIYWHFSKQSQPAWKKLIWHGIDSYNPLAAFDVKHVIETFKPDIISCHNLPGFTSATWKVAEDANVPAIQVLHDYYSLCPKSTIFKNNANCSKPCSSCALFRLPHSKMSNKVSAVVGVSQAVLNKHLEAGLFAKVPLKKVIYNARTMTLTISPKRNQEELIFGFIGSLTPVKGVEQLIEAFIRVADQSSRKLKLFLAGSGKDQYVTELKQRFGSDNRIEFLGQVDPTDFFKRIDVTVVPSIWHEPLASVVIESLGCGVPVIGTKRGGIPEMIQHETNGLIYDPDEPFALDNAMQKLLDNASLLLEMNKNARPSAEKFLNMDRMLNEHESLYKQIVNYR